MHPSRYRINTGTVPIPDLGDNYLGDNYLNCIYNYRYQFLSKLLFLHPFMQWFSPFCHFVYCLLSTCNVQNCLTLLQFPRGESPAPRTIQRPANHNKSILHSNYEVCKTDCSDPSGIHCTLFIQMHAPCASPLC